MIPSPLIEGATGGAVAERIEEGGAESFGAKLLDGRSRETSVWSGVSRSCLPTHDPGRFGSLPHPTIEGVPVGRLVRPDERRRKPPGSGKGNLRPDPEEAVPRPKVTTVER